MLLSVAEKDYVITHEPKNVKKIFWSKQLHTRQINSKKKPPNPNPEQRFKNRKRGKEKALNPDNSGQHKFCIRIQIHSYGSSMLTLPLIKLR